MKMKMPTATKIAPRTINTMSIESSTTPSRSLLLSEVSLLKTLDDGTRLLLPEESGMELLLKDEMSELLLKDEVFDMFFSGGYLWGNTSLGLLEM